MIKTLASITLVLGLSAISHSVLAATELKFTTAAPKGTPWVKHMETSATSMAEKSSGELKLSIFPSSQLGPETETIKQVSRGRLDMGVFSVNAAATVVPELSLITSPFYWESFEQASCALDNHLTKVFNPLLEKRGLRIVQWQELGWLNLFSVNGSFNTPSTVQAMKLRVANSKSSEILWRGIGAAGVPLAFSDTAPALETGIVKGGELPTISYVASGLGKLAPHLTNTNHVYTPSILLMSTRTWSKLGNEGQAHFNNSLESNQKLSIAVRGAIDFFEKKLIEEGGTVTTLTDEQRVTWRASFTDRMQQELIDSIGQNAEQVFSAMEKAKAACS